MDDQDRVYIVEAGYSYGEDFTVPRLLRLEPDGHLTVIVTADTSGPWNRRLLFQRRILHL